MQEVAAVGYVSPDSALQRARNELEEFRDVMDGVFLPGSIEVRLKEGFRDPAAVAAALVELEAADKVVVDRSTDEVLVRDAYRFNAPTWTSSRPCTTDVANVMSPTLRDAALGRTARRP